jgi:hypothetical protein
MGRDEAALSDFERRVLEMIQSHGSAWVTFEQIVAETLVPPDVVIHVALVLVQRGLIRTNEAAPPSTVELAHASPT